MGARADRFVSPFSNFSSVMELETILVPNPVESRPPPTPLSALHSPSTFDWLEEPEADLTPANLDDEEIEAYAEECSRRAALAEFEDIPEEELFNWCPDELDDAPHSAVHEQMDMS